MTVVSVVFMTVVSVVFMTVVSVVFMTVVSIVFMTVVSVVFMTVVSVVFMTVVSVVFMTVVSVVFMTVVSVVFVTVVSVVFMTVVSVVFMTVVSVVFMTVLSVVFMTVVSVVFMTVVSVVFMTVVSVVFMTVVSVVFMTVVSVVFMTVVSVVFMTVVSVVFMTVVSVVFMTVVSVVFMTVVSVVFMTVVSVVFMTVVSVVFMTVVSVVFVTVVSVVFMTVVSVVFVTVVSVVFMTVVSVVFMTVVSVVFVTVVSVVFMTVVSVVFMTVVSVVFMTVVSVVFMTVVSVVFMTVVSVVFMTVVSVVFMTVVSVVFMTVVSVVFMTVVSVVFMTVVSVVFMTVVSVVFMTVVSVVFMTVVSIVFMTVVPVVIITLNLFLCHKNLLSFYPQILRLYTLKLLFLHFLIVCPAHQSHQGAALVVNVLILSSSPLVTSLPNRTTGKLADPDKGSQGLRQKDSNFTPERKITTTFTEPKPVTFNISDDCIAGEKSNSLSLESSQEEPLELRTKTLPSKSNDAKDPDRGSKISAIQLFGGKAGTKKIVANLVRNGSTPEKNVTSSSDTTDLQGLERSTSSEWTRGAVSEKTTPTEWVHLADTDMKKSAVESLIVDDATIAGLICPDVSNSSIPFTVATDSQGRLDSSTWSVDVKNMNVFDTSRSLRATTPKRSFNQSHSCKHRCGQDTSYPCSCDEKCVVYETCCEDMIWTCRELYDAARISRAHLLRRSVRCDPITATYLVQSCTTKSHEMVLPRQHTGPLHGSHARTSLDQTETEIETKEEEAMRKILLNAPVTDYELGITFANLTIAECNRLMPFGASEQSAAGTWKTQMGTLNKKTPNRMVSVQQEVDLSTFSYVPPESHPMSAGSLCYNSQTLSCISEVSVELGIQDVKCNMSVTEYYRRRFSLLSVSRSDQRLSQFVCAFCLSKHQQSSEVGHRFFLHGFKVLMSFSKIPGKVDYFLHEDSKLQRRPIPWQSWTCDITDQVSSGSCQVLQCDHRFLLTPSGLCRKAVEAAISIKDEILIKGQTCKIDPKAFETVSKCYLRSFHKLRATQKPVRIYHVHQTFWDINLIALRMEMYFEVDIYEDLVVNLLSNYFQFYTAIYVHAGRNCSMTEDQAVEHDSQSNSPLVSDQKSLSSEDFVPTERGGKSPKDAREAPILETPFDVLFSFCLQLNVIDGSLYDPIDCTMLSNRYNHDLHSFKFDDLVQEVRGLTCVQDAGKRDRSKGCKTRVSLGLVHLIIVIIFFVL